MAHLYTHNQADDYYDVKRLARQSGHVQRAQTMLLAAGMAAFGIVAVAAAMMTTLF